MLNQLKEIYNKIKEAHVDIRSLRFVKFVILLSFIPIGLYLGAWLYALYGYSIGTNVTALIGILTELRQFVGVIFSTQVVSAVIAYGVALIDKDNDGESDELETKARDKQGE